MGSAEDEEDEESSKTTFKVEIGLVSDKYLNESRTQVRLDAGLIKITPQEKLCAMPTNIDSIDWPDRACEANGP